MNEPYSCNRLPTQLGSFIWRYLRNQKWCLLVLGLNAFIWALHMSLMPYLTKLIVNRSIDYAHHPTQLVAAVLLPSLCLVGMTLILNLNFRLHEYMEILLFPNMKVAINKDMLTYTLHHSNAFFQNRFSGNITKKIMDISENIESLITIPADLFVPLAIGLVMACFTLVTAVHPIFGIILFIWTLLFVYLTYLSSIGTESLSEKASESNASMMGVLLDALTNVSSIKLFNSFSYEMRHFTKAAVITANDDRSLKWYNLKINFIRGLGLSALITAMVCALIVGAQKGWVSPGDFALVLTLSMSFMNVIDDIGSHINQFSKLLGTCKQALSIIQTPHEIFDAPNAQALVISKGNILFNQVSFHYENLNPIFNNLTVKINSGEKIGLVGHSGAGKSSFIKLILRIMDPQSGQILIDNQDIKTITQDSLYEQIATIQQDPELFHRSIKDNIRFAKLDASDEEIYDAAKKAQCHEFILELPKQYDTWVGDHGVKLSGGQKQRIAIARAFLKNAPILLFDEATSSLDSVTESYIHDALEEVMNNKTTLVIAHRLSTLISMDRLLVFANGCIIEDGSIDSLLANKNGHFYQLWHMQLKGFMSMP